MVANDDYGPLESKILARSRKDCLRVIVCRKNHCALTVGSFGKIEVSRKCLTRSSSFLGMLRCVEGWNRTFACDRQSRQDLSCLSGNLIPLYSNNR
jgi:hypothetical protein